MFEITLRHDRHCTAMCEAFVRTLLAAITMPTVLINFETYSD